MPFLVQRLICLRHMIIVFLIRSHVYHLVRDTRIFGIGFINFAVWRLHKTVFVDPRITRKGIDQPDIRTLGRLDGAHSPVMRIVHIAHLKPCAVSRETSGAKCGQTSLVCQLTQRIVLVHKLGQLGGAKKLLDRRRHRLDIDQTLR